ncbi:ichor [Episyrphus balteatus]|uniref:ichor n=1 Tax=Episyrphus balteatus TaxID=286459 RepID=UPI0024855D1E|nr:ichor [Episyrphus balteatus]
MRFCRMNGPNESEVESLLMSPCWGQTQNGSQDQYLLDGHKLLLEHDLDSLPSESDQKGSLDVLDNLLMNSSSLGLSELKPLPPFTGYTGHLSINGISGHHYHAIAQRLPDESNNNYAQSAYHTTTNQSANNNNGGSSADQNIVSSSTCLPESVLSSDGNDACLSDVKLFADSQLDSKLYSVADSCVMSDQGPDSVSGVYVDMSSIDDIAAIIGSAIADTTVPNQLDNDDGNDTRDSWMDIDAWIDGNCIQQDGKLIVSQQDSLSEFVLPHSPVNTSNSTLQSLLTHGYMPLLQNRLQNGPPLGAIKSEAPSSTSYCNELTSSTSTSPPGSVVSTTDNMLINGNSRYLNSNPPQYSSISISSNSNAMKADGICSPDILGNYPHTTTVTPISTPKSKRQRSQKKSSSNNHQHQQTSSSSGSNSSGSQQMQQNSMSPSSVNFNTNDLSGLLGKEKPVHRCNICNRGFLNKSNIKVHLRTHTGEKPFRCDVCAKAFRQKAHLLKHQQIHKRIGRD